MVWKRIDMLINPRKVYLSFGGLLLVMQGPYKKLTGLKIEHLYLLVKK